MVGFAEDASSTSKVYVAVDAHFDETGKISPMRITWEDGRVFEVDAVLDVRRAASLSIPRKIEHRHRTS